MRTEYTVACGSSPAELELEVNAYLEQDWHLQGGISVGGGDNSLHYCQAMIKRNTDYAVKDKAFSKETTYA